MRYLRTSIYADALMQPLTTVAGEDSMTDTLESVRLRLLQPGVLVIHEIFESNGDLEAATFEAIKRQRANAEQEAHQALLYFWTVSKWHRITEHGTVFMDKPAPMSREEIVVVFDQLRQHPDYGHRTIVSHDRSGARVTMVDGEIKED